MTDRDNITRTRARTPGVVAKPLHGGARSGLRPGSGRATGVTTQCTKDGCKPVVATCMSGADLSEATAGKAPSERPAFQPYRGKPAVRNERGDRGNVGIMRSPLRASILPALATYSSAPRRPIKTAWGRNANVRRHRNIRAR